MKLISGDDTFRALDGEAFVFFYFTASWCGPCQRILPEILKLSEVIPEDKIVFYKIDIDDSDNDEICETCQIKSVPTFYLFKDRTFVSKVEGANIQGIYEMLETNCNIKFTNE